MKEVRCPVCGVALRLSPARSRKSKNPKTFLMLACPENGRHFRGFISDREFVERSLNAAMQQATDVSDGDGS